MRKFTNPIARHGADPWFLLHEDTYYYCFSGRDGVCVSVMKHFCDLESATPVCVWQPPEGTMYSKELWAPEIHYFDGMWYIYVAADDGRNETHRMYVLRCAEPLGQYEFVGKITDPTDRWAIDGTVMTWKDKRYFVWSGWEGDVNWAQHLYIAEMADPCTIKGERVRISTPDQPWERLGGKPDINEGPVALEWDGAMHLVYSGSGSWCDDYCLGVLTLRGDNPMDAAAWVKHPQPILSKSDVVFGPGHNCFTTAPDGSLWCIFHANTESGSGWGGRRIWAQPVGKKDGLPFIGQPAPAGETLEVAE